MTDFYIDPATHDLDLFEGDFRYTTLEEQTRQRLEITLRAYRGEWFANKLYGVPYLENEDNKIELLGKSSTELLEIILKREILDSPNIKQLISFGLVEDKPTRKVTITFEALMIDGNPITQTVVL